MQGKPIICAAVAVGPYNIIGQNGVMPWHCKSDLYHFQKITIPYPCIFGRTTFENLPYTPLAHRFNIVCSHQYKNTMGNGIFYGDSIESALRACANSSRVFICGGAKIYSYAFNHDLIDILYLTIIKNPELEQSAKKNLNLYSKFQPGTEFFFDSPTWDMERIFYPKNELPLDTNNTTAEFFKFNRTR